MMIYELVCDKVCHAICPMAFGIVENQAEMQRGIRRDTFTFNMRGEKVTVEFNPGSYYITINGGKFRECAYSNENETDGIAYDIVICAENLITSQL